MVWKPFSPTSSPQEFSTRQRRGAPSSRSTPVRHMAWVSADSRVTSRSALVMDSPTPYRPS